ncbi:MAG: MarR family transcriptional regulator [Actinomycetota bacterium]|nr:MarR family transcriptional regulator [Acidimicrobiia bacterium]MDQ3294151.1 MarR family transcriptional regulator [Actinomycetota bacterium]
MAPTTALDHPILTAVGLFLEAHAGLTRTLEHQLDDECGLSHQWFEVLIRLARTPGERLRMSDLAAQTTLTPSGLTRAVDRLEAAGLVTREACPNDRRSAYAVLTDDGRARILDAVPKHLAAVAALMNGALSDDELVAFERIMRKLRDRMNPCAAATSTPSRG